MYRLKGRGFSEASSALEHRRLSVVPHQRADLDGHPASHRGSEVAVQKVDSLIGFRRWLEVLSDDVNEVRSGPFSAP